MIHIVRMSQDKARYWFASCSCGWLSTHVAQLWKAERDGELHVREHNEVNE